MGNRTIGSWLKLNQQMQLGAASPEQRIQRKETHSVDGKFPVYEL
jgi:hypothetical protein